MLPRRMLAQERIMTAATAVRQEHSPHAQELYLLTGRSAFHAARFFRGQSRTSQRLEFTQQRVRDHVGAAAAGVL